MARKAHAERARRKIKVWRRSSRAHSLRFWGPKQCSLSWPNQGFGASCYIKKEIMSFFSFSFLFFDFQIRISFSLYSKDEYQNSQEMVFQKIFL